MDAGAIKAQCQRMLEQSRRLAECDQTLDAIARARQAVNRLERVTTEQPGLKDELGDLLSLAHATLLEVDGLHQHNAARIRSREAAFEQREAAAMNELDSGRERP